MKINVLNCSNNNGMELMTHTHTQKSMEKGRLKSNKFLFGCLFLIEMLFLECEESIISNELEPKIEGK